MNWRLEKACSIVVRNVGADDTNTIIKVSLVAILLDQVCIGLCLLREGLITTLDLVDTTAKMTLRLERAGNKGSTKIQSNKGRAVLSLDQTEIERWMHFTLRMVRDGVAEVNHIDLDAPMADQSGRAISVVVTFPSSLPPVSEEEARRRLGMQNAVEGHPLAFSGVTNNIPRSAQPDRVVKPNTKEGKESWGLVNETNDCTSIQITEEKKFT
jgi:hypothetical protein